MASTVFLKTVVKHLVDGTLDESLCRICLQPLGPHCENIFTKICQNETDLCVAEILETVCNVKFTESDNYSVCSECFVRSFQAYYFFSQFERSNVILDFYVDLLQKNVDMIDIPQRVYSESLCLTLEEFLPDLKCVLNNIENLSKKDYEIVHNEVVKMQPVRANKLVKTPRRVLNIKVEKNIKEEIKNEMNEDENVLIVVKENGTPTYFKINDNGLLESLNVKAEPKTDKKVRKKRSPMPYIKCSQCDVRLRFLAKLKKHMKLVHDTDFFICKLCRATTENEQEFHQHLKMHTNVHQCAICDTVFKKRDTIIAHLKWHEQMKNLSKTDSIHVCEMCGFILPDEEKLNEHYDKKHDKKHTCHYCGRMYRLEKSLEKHINKHEFHLKIKDRENENIKADDKKKNKFKCNVCSKYFVDERALRWHTMLHTNERPFACDQCGRRFISANRRNQHAACAHSAPTRRCPLCPALFHMRSMVNSHIKKVHLKTRKRRNRTSKYQQVTWRTETVPIQDLSVAVQNELLEYVTV